MRAMVLTQPAPVYTIRSSLKGLDVNRALSAMTTMKDFLLGSASVTTDVRGSGSSAPAIQKSLTGTVKFQLVNGVIKNFPLLARVNQALGITEGNDNDTKFESLSGTAAIGGGKAKTNDLLLKAGEAPVAAAALGQREAHAGAADVADHDHRGADLRAGASASAAMNSLRQRRTSYSRSPRISRP